MVLKPGMYSGEHPAECHRCFILREKWQFHTINHGVRIAYLHAATYVENGKCTLGAEPMLVHVLFASEVWPR
jgi:hypothetical protein